MANGPAFTVAGAICIVSLPSSPPYPFPRTDIRFARGFALLITITLVAFLVLLLVGLATLTRVETRVATNSQSQDKARQNALMALNIAIGQLQKYTGPDQRVTAAADIASAADGTRLPSGAAAQNTASVNGTANGLGASSSASVQTGTRWWTGVWGRSGASYSPAAKSIYEEAPSPVLLNWLVSGNENLSFTTDASGWVASSGGGTAPLTPGAAVNWTVAGLDPLAPGGWSGTSTYSDLEINTSGQKAVLLLGPRTAGTDSVNGEVATERYVVAPLQDIKVPSAMIGMGSSGDTTVGRYAWWVGDEGIKASYALADPNAGQNNPDSSGPARLRLMSSPRSGIELVANWQNYPSANDTDAAAKFSRVLELQQAPMLTPSLTEESQRASVHDFTRLSRGLITDTLNGGLRQDLTHWFEQSPSSWSASPLAGHGIIPAPWSPDWGGGDTAPKWDWLYSFYNTNPSVTTSALAVRPESATQVGVIPVIAQFRLILFTEPADMHQATPNIKGMPAEQTYNLPVRCNVVFVLANPYDATLTASAGEMEFVLKNARTGSDGLYIRVGLGAGKGEELGRYNLLRAADSSDPDGMLDTIRFTVPQLSIPPGESVTLAVAGNGQVLADTNGAAEDPVNTVPLEIKTASKPVLSGDYFTGRHTLDFTTPAPTADEKDADGNVVQKGDSGQAGAALWQDEIELTITLRNSSTKVAYQEIGPVKFNKNGQVNSYAGHVYGSGHVKLVGPALRNLNWETNDFKTQFGYYTYGRLYQDSNIRAGRATHPNVTVSGGTYVLLTPPPYGAGVIYPAAGGTADRIVDAFKDNLHPATWTEDFSDDLRVGALRGVFFDFPRRTTDQPPVISIGQLQHASLSTNDITPGGTIGYESAYAVGNSYSHPHVTRGAAVQDRDNHYEHATGGTTRYFDMAYLLNTALWDGYFFSGIPQTGADATPLNPRYVLDDPATVARDADSAAHLFVKGAFNINSTSHDAWVALLGGLNGLRVNGDTENTGVPYPRTLWQPEPSENTGGSFQTSGTGDLAYGGYRRLNAGEIDALATEIVKRVRARGPFVSLSHFVNRSLVAATSDFNPNVNDADSSGALASSVVPMGRGLAGPLQAAIDSTEAGINTFIEVGGQKVTAKGAGHYGDRVLFNGEIVNSIKFKPDYDNSRTPFYADKIVDAPHVEWDIDKEALPGPAGRTSTGIPGWLLQGDLLQALGPALSARSDTFVIRAYGEAVNPADSNDRQARAWCEALVQRVPDYVDSTADDAKTRPADLTSAANKTFGRGYKVVGFRWLTADDI